MRAPSLPLRGVGRNALWLLALIAALPAVADESYKATGPGYGPSGNITGAPADGSRTDTRLMGASDSTGGSGRSSWWSPDGGRGSIGLNVGRSRWHAPCGAGFGCDDTDNYVHLYARNMVNDMWGGELGLLHMGRMDRGGGRTHAYGLDLNLVGKAPIASTFGVYGKIGTVYGHTSTDVAAGSNLTPGTKNGFGLSLGAGVSWDFSPKLSAVLEWDRYDFRFAGTGRDAIHATSLGLQYRY